MEICRNTLVTVTLLVTLSVIEAKLPLDDSTAIVNQLFTYDVDPQDFPSQTIKVTEAGRDDLPSWLTYDSGANQLVGVPTTQDKGTAILSIGEEMFAITVSEPTKSQVARPLSFTEEIVCKPHDSITVAYVKLNADTDSLPGEGRSRLVRSISQHLKLHSSHISVSSRPKDLLDSNVALVSGAGDTAASDDGLSVLSWIVGCGAVKSHHMDILEKVESSAKDGSMSKLLGTPVSGWQVQSNQPKLISKRRLKRGIVTATPSPEPETDDATTPMSLASPDASSSPVTPSATTPGPTTPEPTTPESETDAPVTDGPVVPEPMNMPPQLNMDKLMNGGTLPNKLTGGMIYSYELPQGLFTDPEGDDIEYSIESNKPNAGWIIHKENQLRTLAQASLADMEEELTLTATDSQGGRTTTMLKAEHGPNKLSDLTEIYTVKVEHTKYNNNKPLRDVKLAQDLERATRDSDILITNIREISPGRLQVKFGIHRGMANSCPTQSNSNVRAALEESIGKMETFMITEVMPFERQSPCTYTAPEVNTDVMSSHNKIELYVGELFETTLPVDLFTDERDGDLSNMMLKLYADGQVDGASWITLDSSTRKLQALVVKNPEIKYQFSLEATNSEGLSAEEPLDVTVIDNSESTPSHNLFTITLDENYSHFEGNIKKQVELYNRLSKAFPQGTTVSIKGIESGSVVVSYSLDDKAAYTTADKCPKDLVQSYTETQFDENGDIKESFIRSLGSYELKKAEFVPLGACEGEFEPISAELVADKDESKDEEKDGGNMTVIIIVIIVVLVLVILLVVVVVCVIKKRKANRAAKSNGKNGSYIEKGVPVVMESEMKDINDKHETEPLVSANDSADVSYKPTPPAYPGDDKSDDKYQPPTPPTSEPED